MNILFDAPNGYRCSFFFFPFVMSLTVQIQVIAGYMMIEALNKKGYNAFAFSVPSLDEFVQILGLAAPVFVTMMSKVCYILLGSLAISVSKRLL